MTGSSTLSPIVVDPATKSRPDAALVVLFRIFLVYVHPGSAGFVSPSHGEQGAAVRA